MSKLQNNDLPETKEETTTENIEESDEIDEIDDEIDDIEEEEEEEGDDDITSDVEKQTEEKEQCVYENVNEENEEDISYEDGVNEILFDDDNIQDNTEDIITNPEERITRSILYHYEKVRIIGDRTKQLSLGAKPMIKKVDHMDPKDIALLELEKDVLPIIIYRPLPNGKKEKWYLRELKK